VDLREAEAKEGERQADRVRRRGELLGEQDQPDRPEQVQRPGDRPRDQQGRERRLD
jgi:hypothetical protein